MTDIAEFLSTYPVRGTTRSGGNTGRKSGISIHVPRAGYDLGAADIGSPDTTISIHVPRAGYDRFPSF